MRLRDRLLLWLLMASATYTVGPFTVTAQTPVLAYQSASAGAYAWFTWLSQFKTGELCLRIFAGPDSTDPATGDLHGYSSDGGASWVVGTAKYNGGGDGPWMQAPPSAVASGAHYRLNCPLQSPKLFGAGYLTTDAGGGTTLKGDWIEMQDGGKTYYRRGAQLTITGLPRALSSAYGQWYGDVCYVSANRWLSPLYLKMGGDTRFSTIVLECTDGKGLAWAYVGTPFPAATVVSSVGASEASLLLLPSGELMAVSRVDVWSGDATLARAFSSDFGRTWGAIDRVPASRVAPRLWRLSGTGDIAILAGNSVGGGAVALGCWLGTDPHGSTWNNFDILAHHNAMIADPNLQIPGSGGATGYLGVVELGPNRLLVSYDRARGAYGLDASPNSIFVMDFTITR